MITSKIDQLKTKDTKTPFFIYDVEIINQQIDKILDAFSDYPNFQLFYALKANSSKFIVREIKKRKVGLAVSSLGELKLALRYGFKNISYSAPYTPKEVFELAKNNDVEINYNTLSEIKDRRLVGLRVNPEIGWSYLKDHAAASIFSQFGVSINELAKDKEKIIRLHMHTSSDSYKINVFVKAFKKLLLLAEKYPKIETINIGGGIAIPIGKNEKEFDIKIFGKEITKLIKDFNIKNNKKIRLQFEPGNYIARPSGFYVCQVMTKEKKYGQYHYFTNGTKHHLKGISDIEQFSTIDNKNKSHLSTVVGCTCQRSDIIIQNKKIPELKIGDFIVISMAGAYCAVLSDNFHLLETPREFIFHKERQVYCADRAHI